MINLKNIKILLKALFAKEPRDEQVEQIDQADLKYVDDLNSAILLKSPHQSRRVIYMVAGFMIVAIVWAGFAEIDEVTVGEGKVIPSQQIQVVQNLEGGILKSIFVKEGDTVEIGQRLLTIDETRFLSDYREQETQRFTLGAREYRLRQELTSVVISQIDGQYEVKIEEQSLAFPDLDPVKHSELIQRQRSIYDERIRNLRNQLQILQQQVNQKRTALAELSSKVGTLEQSYKLVAKELSLTRPLAKRGVVSEVELIKLERTANDVKGELQSARISMPKLEAEIREVTNKREEVALKFRNDTQERLQEVEGTLAGMDEILISLRDRLTRTLVVSPVKGTIKTININTVGGVIQPGMDLIEIVPIEDSLLIEAKILPKDIAFLRPNLNAVIKLTAYDFAIYGGLKGKVEHISADTIKDEETDESYYHIKVRTEDSYFDKNNDPLPIIPGMTASVDVITGKKTVLDYLLKPIIRAKHNALREK
ncbi:HlyD family type I secretion periplasmic adaptor subunit [Saccharobesus litoralis]|uniref:Membrane fusion protein (MFP) family protein n=1 Tax=Saccharobesus litoralis TaxID=2172099 RepID=A0A2S0VRW7_9ALTE|nr:HlyD family type I secretion periplasmic adaptor subunit [Saccharobesus litoralis]AWB66958.1 HlyD family type I secretion periplasmic adaptor subunit [Saccharobesus litoralis]